MTVLLQLFKIILHVICFSLQFADSLKVEYKSGMSCYYKLAVYAAKKESVVETLADHLRIAEAEFVVDEFFTSTAKLELELTFQGRQL